jgi:hypothetical protein
MLEPEFHYSIWASEQLRRDADLERLRGFAQTGEPEFREGPAMESFTPTDRADEVKLTWPRAWSVLASLMGRMRPESAS